jgi:hypothetical protein
MWMQFAIPFLQLILKLLPFLHQIKIFKSEADLKAIQQRFETAIRKAEEGTLDSARLKKQHDENIDDLRAKRERVWGNGSSVPTQPPTPSTGKPTVTVDVAAPETGTEFRVTVTGLTAQDSPEIWVDEKYSFGGMIWTGTAHKKPLVLNTGGERTLDIKLGGRWVSSMKVTVQDHS